MSARFWLFSMASAGAAMAAGLGLGLYATTPPRSAFTDYAETGSTGNLDTAPDAAGLNGPAEVRCTGCGPTLADRQMAATMGGWDGYNDPVVRDYQARSNDAPEDLLTEAADAPPSPVHQLPANIDRFAAGEAPTPQTVQLAQGGAGATEAAPAIQP